MSNVMGMVIGADFYNQTIAEDVSFTLRNARADSDHIQCVLVLQRRLIVKDTEIAPTIEAVGAREETICQ